MNNSSILNMPSKVNCERRNGSLPDAAADGLSVADVEGKSAIEKALTACVLLDEKSTWPTFDQFKIDHEDFSDLRFRAIIRTCFQMRSDNERIDPITLEARASRDGKLQECGGKNFIADFINNQAVIENADEYSRSLKRYRWRRQFDDVCDLVSRYKDQPTVIPPQVLIGGLAATFAELKRSYSLADGTAENVAAIPLFDISSAEGRAELELLKHRYLCRGGGLLLVGPTGIGKSSFAMQAAILWALGLPCFGIIPAKQIKSLLIQAENDEGDLAEMRDGICRGLGLTSTQKAIAAQNIFVFREDRLRGQKFFSETVSPLLTANKPDILWIDPALAYVDGESNSQRDVGAFLRTQLNPLLNDHNCGCVIAHHTNKPPSGEQKQAWGGNDFAYLGSGSAEWANWARAVIAIRGLSSNNVFELRAGKRGSRLGWRESDGETTAYAKIIAHSTEPGVICWREADEAEIPSQNSKRGKMASDLLPHVPIDKPILKESLIHKGQAAGIGSNKARMFIDELVDGGSLHIWENKRKNARSQILLARFEQPQPELGQ